MLAERVHKGTIDQQYLDVCLPIYTASFLGTPLGTWLSIQIVTTGWGMLNMDLIPSRFNNILDRFVARSMDSQWLPWWHHAIRLIFSTAPSSSALQVWDGGYSSVSHHIELLSQEMVIHHASQFAGFNGMTGWSCGPQNRSLSDSIISTLLWAI